MRRHRSLLATLVIAGSVCAVAGANSRDRRIIDAAKTRDTRAVQALARQQAHVNARQADGATALHWAAHWDDVAMATALIKAGADVNAVNDYGVAPLSLAATNGSAAMIELLLDAGAKVDAALPLGETALMTAARTGKLEAVRVLLRRGADVNVAETSQRQTALMWALAEHHPDVVRALLEAGADPRAASGAGFTPLMFAAREGDVDMARLLMAAGASVAESTADGFTPLLIATIRGHVSLAEFFLDHGADPNTDTAGYTALHWAAGKWETEFTKEYTIPSGEWSVLGGLPRQIKIDFIKTLLAHGADVSARLKKMPPRFGGGLSRHNLEGATPFLVAAMSADTEVMRLLLAAGADPVARTSRNGTALLLAAGMDRNGGSTRITEAESIAAMQLAIDLGNDLNAGDSRGETALHVTAYNGTNAIARYLLDKGAVLEVKNRNGQTPLGVAEAHYFIFMLLSNKSTAALFRQYGATELGAPPFQTPYDR